MSSTKTVFTAGFAMFCMFFGAGNLVFPLVIGTQSLNNASYAMLGLAITGVLVPFLGLVGVILYNGDRSDFFSCIGKVPAFILIFVMLSLLGPIGVVPRCIVVAHGAVTSFCPNFSLALFSFLFCLFSLFLIWKHDSFVPLIGRYLTPCLLVGIATISMAGIFFSNLTIPPSDLSSAHAFKVGIVDGYQTMDLIAAFFFSTATITYIRTRLQYDDSPQRLLKLGLTSSVIGAGLIGIVYIGFVILGAKHAPNLLNTRPEQMLSTIAGHTLGPIAIPLVSITIIIACLTTAAILALLFANFLNEDVFRHKLGAKNAVILTLLLSFSISLIGFTGLKLWLGTILQIFYPALIILTLVNIINKMWNIPHFSRWAFWLTAISSTLYYIVSG